MERPGTLSSGIVFATDYRVVRPLQAGGMGAVYVVEQLSTGSQRALKVMLPELVDSEEQRRRFEQEARVGSQIKSDHVVQVLAAGVDDATGMPWLVMELLEGEDLACYAKRNGPLPAADVVEMLTQACHALAAAHRAGIVHRDLKPENLFISEPMRDGVPFTLKVLDYGQVEDASGATVRQSAQLQAGINSDKARELNKFIKGLGLKGVQSSTQGDQLRVSSKKRDDLQAVMASIREADFGLPLQFTNRRD